MMNQKINTNCKKETLLTGQICFPLRIGERAVIIGTGSRSIITSTVLLIQEVSADGVVFETQNTIYHLSYIKEKSGTGASSYSKDTIQSALRGSDQTDQRDRHCIC